MLALVPDQKDILLKTLFDLHPSARESISAILSTITSAPSSANIISKSIYFGEQVLRCHRALIEDDWRNYYEESACDIRHGTASALESSLDFIGIEVGDHCRREEADLLNPGCSSGDFKVDAWIAVLDIGLILSGRQKRIAPSLNRDDATWASGSSYTACRLREQLKSLESLWLGCLLPNLYFKPRLHTPRCDTLEQAKWRARQSAEWKAFHTAVRYATRDDQSHPLRDAILKYIELPPILPHPGPDEKLETGPDDYGLKTCLKGIGHVLRSDPADRESKIVLDLQRISIR